MSNWDLVVVGGGIVGASAAYHAARAGARVLLIDRDDAGRATAVGAGIVSPETDVHHAGPYFELARRAGEEYPALIDALPRRAGYQRCGMLVVAADDDEARAFDAFARSALDRQRARTDLPADDALRPIDSAEAIARFPPLAPVQRALWNPRGARVDGREITAALTEAAIARGAQRRGGSVEALLVDRGAGETPIPLGVEPTRAGADDGRAGEASGQLTARIGTITGVIVDGERIPGGAVIVAGGAWTPALTAGLGVRVRVEPQRGQIAHLRLEGADSAAWPMVSGFRGHYLVAWPGGRVAAGATRETGSGFDPRPTAAGVREVLAEALRLAPGLASATLIEMRVGLRPLAIDGLPVLGPVPGCAGLWLATGHGPAGLTLGPLSGKLVAEAALGGAWPEELDAFSVARAQNSAE